MENALKYILDVLNSTEVNLANSVFRLVLSMILGVCIWG